jgi:hypothetical protein
VLIYYTLVHNLKKNRKLCLRNKYYIVPILLLFLCVSISTAQEPGDAVPLKPKDYSLDLQAITGTVADTSGKVIPYIQILFTPDPHSVGFTFKRKTKYETDWTFRVDLDSAHQGFYDTTIVPGVEYEYAVYKDMDSAVARSHISSGVDVRKDFYEGNILLVIDETMKKPLSNELGRYYMDLIGEGWFVDSVYVPRTEKFDPQRVQDVKSIIIKKYEELGGKLRSVFLIGRVAVPYSGNIAPDGHDPHHRGAWPADLYYADMDGVWTDTIDYKYEEPVRPEIINKAGDGKFDNSIIPAAQGSIVGEVELELGRVDFFNLPEIEVDEVELLRQYFDKNHRYRNRIFTPRKFGLIDDRFLMYSNEVFASNAWSNFSSLLSRDSIVAKRFRDGMQDSSYMWAYGCNSGGFNSVQDIAYTSEMMTYEYKSVFTLLFGSWFADWDVENNMYRSILASNPATLTCSWAGRPFWHFHNMGMAETIGYSTKLTQNNNYFYRTSGRYGYKEIHISLMGDPTLKMFIPDPPTKNISSIDINKDELKVNLSWFPSNDKAVLGYNIFRTDKLNQVYEKLNDTLITINSFVDINPPRGHQYYFVRAEKYEVTNSGSFYYHSPSATFELSVPEFFLKEIPVNTISVYPTPSKNKAEISFTIEYASDSRVVVYDSQGKEVRVLANRKFEPGRHTIFWDLTKENGQLVATGMYFVQLEKRPVNLTTKLIITK